ncbi:MAG: hypothetical protein ACRD3D_16565 [Terriglobia bacterium]
MKSKEATELPHHNDARDRETASLELGAELDAIQDRLRELERCVEGLRTQFDGLAAMIRVSGSDAPEAGDQPSPSPSNGAARPAPAEAIDPEKLRVEAQRYARLLVSEIELYNPAEVARGREHKDLYARLKFHIERSRKAYQSKFGTTLDGQPDYFHEEMVRALAGSDPTVLGLVYPHHSA